MPTDKRPGDLEKSVQAFQRTVERSASAWAASYTLIGAIVLFGGLGYGFDRWRGSAPWGLFGGLVLGLVIGFYQLARAVWRR
ncbi:MAG TPA: AtpZ/AtpI family protein [Vicinamibacterales bacterium]|nr:AtpZ/AtpI family protein [Vicinamibacterales bacterium]